MICLKTKYKLICVFTLANLINGVAFNDLIHPPMTNVSNLVCKADSSVKHPQGGIPNRELKIYREIEDPFI